MTSALQICLIQERFLVGDIKANTRKIIALSQQARQAGADIAVFPELALSGYPPEDLLMRAGFVQQIKVGIAAIARSSNGIIIVFGAPVMQEHALFNAAVVCINGEVSGAYFKHSLPNYAVFDW